MNVSIISISKYAIGLKLNYQGVYLCTYYLNLKDSPEVQLKAEVKAY